MYWFFHLIFYYRCVEIRASLCDWHVYTQGIHIYVIALSVREIPPFSFLRGVSRSVCCSGALTGNSSPVNMVVQSALRGPVARGVFFCRGAEGNACTSRNRSLRTEQNRQGQATDILVGRACFLSTCVIPCVHAVRL